MYLVVGANSEIGAATAQLLRSRGGDVMATTRRSSEATADSLHLDFEQPMDGFTIPKGIMPPAFSWR